MKKRSAAEQADAWERYSEARVSYRRTLQALCHNLHQIPSDEPANEHYLNACNPVIALPMISECTSCVPSYVYTLSRFAMCRML